MLPRVNYVNGYMCIGYQPLTTPIPPFVHVLF